MGYFHIRSLENGLRFPLLDFVIEVLNDYEVALYQLASNAWRIFGAFYIGCKKKGSLPPADSLSVSIMEEFVSITLRAGRSSTSSSQEIALL